MHVELVVAYKVFRSSKETSTNVCGLWLIYQLRQITDYFNVSSKIVNYFKLVIGKNSHFLKVLKKRISNYNCYNH